MINLDPGSVDALAAFINSIVTKTIDAAIKDGRLQPVQTQHDGVQKKTLTTREVAERYNVKVSTLQDWRGRSMGPVYTKPGRNVLYRVEDLEAFFSGQRVRTRESDRLARSSR
ncbi:helix-turn-helix domain-containing protein [Humidesulfovibrio idahonensis]